MNKFCVLENEYNVLAIKKKIILKSVKYYFYK